MEKFLNLNNKKSDPSVELLSLQKKAEQGDADAEEVLREMGY